MKRIYYIIWILALGMLMPACDDSSDDLASGLEIIKSDVTFAATGGTGTINVSDTDVTASSNADWCTVKTEGNTVKVTVAFNPGLEGRTALITLLQGNTSKSVPVTQAGNRIPTADDKELTLPATGKETRIFIIKTTSYTATSDSPTWLTTRIDGDSLVLITSDNFVLAPRYAKVTLVSGNLSDTLDITQSGLVLQPERPEVVFDNDTNRTVVKINSTLAYTATTEADWLTLSTDGENLTIKATENVDVKKRTASITLSSAGLTETILVIQRPSIYSDFLGNWTLKGAGSAVTYNLTFSQKVEGETYSVTGWSGSGIDEDNPITVNFDTTYGMVYIIGAQKLGVFEDNQGTYDVIFRGIVKASATSYAHVGGNYIAMSGMLYKNKVAWIGEDVILSGKKYTFVGMSYWIQDQADGQVYNFNADWPFLLNPVMTKAAPSPASIPVHSRARNTKEAAAPSVMLP